MKPVHELSAAELLGLYRARKLSPVEATDAVLARVDALEPKLNAMFIVDADGARRQAKASEARWFGGEPHGLIDGVPITIKDNILTRGMPAPVGTAAAIVDQSWDVDAPPTARIKEHNAVILGKTTMPDFGMLASGVSSLHGITRNPWNLARNTAGSSSGAGAAVAAGYGPLALGTDIGGSVRLPAAYCGIFAHKPSLGRVPIYPPFLGRVTGPMTRTVEDAALLMNVLTEPDRRDYMSLPHQPVDYLGQLNGDLRGLRFGLLLDIGSGTRTTAEVRAAVEAAASRIEAAGGIVEPAGPIVDQAMMDGLNRFFQGRAWTDISVMPPERQARVHPFIAAWARHGETMTAADAFRALAQIFRLREAAVAAMEHFDYLLTPTSPIPAYAAEEAAPGDNPDRPFEHICFTAPFNQSEQPAASINCGFTSDGMPIGLQIVGERFDDLGVLRVARAFERLRGDLRPWPSP